MASMGRTGVDRKIAAHVFAACALLLLPTRSASGENYFYDLGTPSSDLWPGCERVTVTTTFGPASRFGWQTATGLQATYAAYKEPSYNSSRGRFDPPPIWTNPLTEDSIVGDRENALFV